MDSEKTVVRVGGGGIGISGITFIVLLVLKLTHQIDASWWLVTLPLWWFWGLIAGVLAFVMAIIIPLCLCILIFIGIMAALGRLD